MYVLLFVIAVCVFVAVHEAGHFLTARLFGMKVTQFFIGFGPRIFSWRRGETEYGLKAIPAGGYVKIIGMTALEEVQDEDVSRTFHRRPLLQRVTVLVAGSATHFVMAFLLLVAALVFFPVPVDSQGQPVPVTEAALTPEVAAVVSDSPASSAGLAVGDVVRSVDGAPVGTFEEVRSAILPRNGETVELVVEREERAVTVEVALPDADPNGAAQGFLGIAPAVATARQSLGSAVYQSLTGFYSVPNLTAESLRGLGRAVSPEGIRTWFSQFGGERVAEGPISLVGAAQIVDTLGTQGELFSILVLLANLNLVLGAVNLLPLPPLDGGHVATICLEAGVRRIRRWRGRGDDWHLDPTSVFPIAAAVFLLFALLSVTAVILDIVNPASRLLQ